MKILKHRLIAEKLDIPNFFRIEYTFFHLLGIDLSAVKAHQMLKRAWITYSTTISTCLIIIAMSKYNWSHLDDLDIVCDVLTYIVQSVLAAWKAMIIVYKRKELIALLQLIWNIELKASAADSEVLAKENRTHLRLSTFYCSTSSVTGTIAGYLPIFVCFIAYLANGEFLYLLPFPADYLIDTKQPFNYVAIYILSAFAVHLIVFSTLAVDCLYSWCVHSVTANFQVLQEKLKAFDDFKMTNEEDFKHIRQSVIDCIAYHQQTLELAALLAETFRPIALLEFTLNSTELCVIIFQIGRGVEVSKMIFLCCAVTTISIQLLIYSYSGQKLEDESENCALACYQSVQWKFSTQKEKKLLLLSILRAQRPCKMTAVFFDVNMRTFVWVLRTAASYVTLLWSVAKH